MKTFLALIVALLAVFVSGMEISPSELDDASFSDEVGQVEGGIQPRVTCDLLSGIGYGHFFCASHCLFKGFKGGYCDSRAICNCRN